MFARGFLWAFLARTVFRRFGWLPLVFMAGRMIRQRQRATPPGRRFR
jgi:hypothetical protein